MRRFILLACALIGGVTRAATVVPETYTHTGICDASAGAVVGTRYFVVGNDEENLLNIYQIGHDGPPVRQTPIGGFLLGIKKKGEIDLEGAVRIENRIYWISSHGRNKDAKEQLSRQKFFATEVDESRPVPTLRPVGRPYSNLLKDIIAEPKMSRFNLSSSSRKAPKDVGGFNIEGLAAGPNGSMFIGFRNPLPQGKALLIHLLNPAELIAGGRARFGEPRQLGLQGLGIRDMLLVGNKYYILGGPVGGGQPHRLYEWDGSSPGAKMVRDLQGFNGEALFTLPTSKSVWIVSDEGGQKVGKVECKELKDPNLKSFRSMEVKDVL